MGFVISIPENKDYVLVRLQTDVSKELAMAFTRGATSLAKENDIMKILIDIRGFDSVSKVVEKYEFAYDAGLKLGLTPQWKVAMIRDEDKEDMQFFETVMRNAGFNYRMYTDEKEALTWLEAE